MKQEGGKPMSYDLWESIAGISGGVHADSRFAAYREKYSIASVDIYAWCIGAAEHLALVGPKDYDEAGLDWYAVIDTIADGFFSGITPEKAVERASVV
jgi:hypothetical protein